jgi:hypothetical protein
MESSGALEVCLPSGIAAEEYPSLAQIEQKDGGGISSALVATR